MTPASPVAPSVPPPVAPVRLPSAPPAAPSAPPAAPSTAGPIVPTGLFRQQVLDARATQGVGAIRLAQPIGDAMAVTLAVVVIGSVVSFAVFGSYTKRATAPGFLEPHGGALRLATAATGTVLDVKAVEGRRVAAGDVLFVLSGERLSDSGATQASIGFRLETRRAILERELTLGAARHASRLHATHERLASIDVELARLADERGVNASRQRIADANVARFEALAATGFIAVTQVQARVDDALVLRAQEAALQRTAANLQRERAGLARAVDDSRLQADGERGETLRALAALDQERFENDARRSLVVTSPHDAHVTGIAAHPGQVVGAGALLATLIPDDAPLEAVVFASTRQAGFVVRGQRVRLRYAAFPYQKFGMGDGVVETIEQSPYAPQELSAQAAATLGASASQSAEPVYRIVVRIDAQSMQAYGEPQPLKPGMVVEADIVQDRRRLIEWLLEPIYGLVGRSADRPPSPSQSPAPKSDVAG